MNQPPHLRQRSALQAYYFALVLFITLLSLAAVSLLSLESFTPTMVLGGAFASLLLSALFFTRYRPSQRMTRPEWGVVALVLLAFALRSNTAIDVYGGQDPGVYTNVASHFAQHGSWIIKDPLLDELADRKDLQDYYVATTLRRTSQNTTGGWYGNMLPGVYLKDLQENEWVSQFYHVNTVWLAIGEWLFGQERKGLPLALLSSLTLIAAYLLTVRVCASQAAGIAAAFLLATNAAHSYIGTFPVSEAVAGFFFLSALAMLSAGFQFTSVLPFAALFLTRITGFLTAPLILISLGWMVIKRRDVKAAWTGFGILCAYGVSVVWGLTFSGPYARDIYRGKLGVPPALLEHAASTFLAVGVVWLLCCFIALRYRERLLPLCKRVIHYRVPLTIAALALIVVAIAYRGYLLGFTDHYAQHRWFGVRWKMAALGVDSLRYLSIYTLSLMLSPLGILAFIIGLASVCRVAFTRSSLAPLALCSIGFFAALTVKQLTTPYLYYFGRYLVSELLPLAIICAAIALHSLTRYLPRLKHLILPAYCLAVLVLLYPSITARLKIREGRQFFEAMSCVNEATPGRSVLLIDKKDFPEVPIVTALRFSFHKPTFGIREADFSEPGKLNDLITYFQSKGYTVYLLSSHDSWKTKEGFHRVLRIPAVVRKVGSRAAPPTKISTLVHPIRLYSLQKPDTLPEICKKVEEYGR